jgi:hypothetical protein
VALALAAVAGACHSSNLDALSSQPHVASASCPLKSPGDWQAFVDSAAVGDGWVTTCADQSNCAERVGDFRTHVQKDVADVLALCTEDVRRNPRIEACTDPLRRFVPAWLRQHDSETYGFIPDNHDYLAAHVAPDMPPGMMDPPAELLAALPKRTSIEAAAQKNGWPYVTHDSCLGGLRTFVVIADPQGRFDRWMLFGWGKIPLQTNHDITSYIAVQKKDAAGNVLPRVRLHFRDYQVENNGYAWQVTLDETFSGKCYSCHASGMRLLMPLHGTMVQSAPVLGEPGYGAPPESLPVDYGWTRLLALNDRLGAYGVPDWTGSIAPEDHGPALGAAQGCTSCHDGKTRGALTVSTSEGALRQKIAELVSMRASGTVPDEAAIRLLDREATQSPPLSPDEQAALASARAEHLADYETFMASRYPALKEWLLRTSCE